MADRGGIETLLHLLEEAFRGRGIEESNESQALLTNLATVPETSWRALPPRASRSIEAIAVHVGACKVMYADYAFGAGSLQFGTPAVEPWGEGAASPGDVVPWLEQAHETLVGHVAALADDAELDRPRNTNWGEHRPTRWIVAAMITHDAYHAGEINHLRSLLDGDDRWRFVQQGFG
ncbi:MAG: DinB family protein [Chloroflexi bacterium]|nr:DinB family protein [Chloroflexota bacterium]